MEITIHDVGHGACSLVTCPNGAKFMIDCGCRSDRSWTPSSEYEGDHIQMLVMQNLDEDHVEDLPSVLRHVNVQSVFSNPYVDANALSVMKPDGMRSGVAAAWRLLHSTGPGLVGSLPYTGDVTAWAFYNAYPTHFTETNNLSVAVYFRWGSFAVLFGGDLEKGGWEQMLNNPMFRLVLPSVRVFVASHHGRANGTFDGLFDFMRPDIAVISDDAIQYETQNTTTWYRERVKGIPVEGTGRGFVPQKRRSVYTTRSDGTVSIRVNRYGGYIVGTSGSRPTLDGLLSAV